MTLVLPLSSGFGEPIVSSEGAAEFQPLWESRCGSKSSPASDAVAVASSSAQGPGQAQSPPPPQGDARAAAGQPPAAGRRAGRSGASGKLNLRAAQAVHHHHHHHTETVMID